MAELIFSRYSHMNPVCGSVTLVHHHDQTPDHFRIITIHGLSVLVKHLLSCHSLNYSLIDMTIRACYDQSLMHRGWHGERRSNQRLDTADRA